MAIIKCKMCGGDLTIEADSTVAECEYCGSRQTVPAVDNEKKLNLFARANRLRTACEFDKAAGVYESIVAEFPEEAEAYWGLVLCKYGIEYVDDPETGNKVPTCHRSSFDSIFSDSDFEQATENADAIARRVYRDEAKQIEEIRKGIIEVSGKEEPYDIFICYKETDENGGRTIDSVIAQDVYDALIDKGYRVFFSRITLEDKLGQEYEPYIFAALNSAKIMLSFGTDYEYFNAVWVKNEWSRFLKLMAADKTKHLIPCYKGVDAYDMPQEFAKLQAQDMGKVGAIQDLIRGIEKLMPKNTESAMEQNVTTQQTVSGTNTEPLLRRGNLFLEDKDWKNANDYFDKVLDAEPECAEAYLGILMAELEVSERKALFTYAINFENNKNYQKAIRFADDALKSELTGYCNAIKERLEQERLEKERQKRAQLEQEKLKKAKLAKRRSQIEYLNIVSKITAAESNTLAVKADGTVLSLGCNDQGQCNVKNWMDIIAVSTGGEHTVGLKTDGTVVAVGSNEFGRCNVNEWTDIIVVSAGYNHTVGLKSDGTVVAVGSNEFGKCDVNVWTDIIAVSAGYNHTVGLKTDGTVVAVGYNEYGRCNVSGWTDIVAISAGNFHTVGLRSDGTVVAVGDNGYYQCDVNSWTDIIAVSAGARHTVGLRSDGKVVATKYTGNSQYYYGQCNVSNWTNIVAVSAGNFHTVGLKSNGTVVAVGDNEYGQCNVSNWKLFNNFETIEQECKIEMARAAEERRVQLTREKRQLQAEFPNLNGFFGSIKRKKAEARIAEIDAELNRLQKSEVK